MTQETIDRIRKMTIDRDWDQFHSPANLAKSISIEANELLESLGFDVVCFDGLSSNYPSDCLVNAAVLGRNIICKPSILHSALIKEVNDNKLNIIETIIVTPFTGAPPY